MRDKGGKPGTAENRGQTGMMLIGGSLIEEKVKNRVVISGITIVFIFGLLNGFYLQELKEKSIIGFWAQDILHFVVVPGVFLISIYLRLGIRPSHYGLISGTRSYPTHELIGASIFAAIVFGLLIIPLDILSFHIFREFGFTQSSFEYSSMVPTGVLKLPVVFYMAITAGFVEEIVYRGIPYMLIFECKSVVIKKRSVYVIGTAVLFAAIHWDSGLHFLLVTFVFGLFAAWLYLQLKNLWPLVGGHFIYDFYIFW